MMKRFTVLALACVMALAMVSIAVAQPKPVVRMGDWVEIGNDAWMNIIATIDTRYFTNHNADFEDRLRDSTSSAQVTTGANTTYGDNFKAEI